METKITSISTSNIIINLANSKSLTSKINYDTELNPAQREAVFQLDGPILCLAGAGSGKTRTIVYRVARLIELGVNPKQILLLTFTNKAANNMLDRVTKLVDIRAKDVSGGTFHSFAYQILQRYGEIIGINPNFSIVDESDVSEIINQIKKSHSLLKDRLTNFLKNTTIQEMISKSKNKLISLEDVIKNEYNHLEIHIPEIIKISKDLEEFKRLHNLLDFDDLLLYLFSLLQEKPQVKEILGNYYKYIMIDEYQDTNIIQANIAIELASYHNNIMVVGDDSQSIFSFRGADISNILNFPKHFRETKIIKLEQSYRNTQQILNATNKLMSNSKLVFSKTLYSYKTGSKPVLVLCNNEYEQSAFIIQRIYDHIKSGLSLSDIAILFRASFHSYNLEVELRKASINYCKWGGLKFFEAAHIKDLLSFVRILINPLDKIAWQRVLSLFEGVGLKTIQYILSELDKLQNPYKIENLNQNLKNIKVKKQIKILSDFFEEISTYVPQKSSEEILERLIEFYLPLLKKKYYDDYPKRIKDLDQLVILSRKFTDLKGFVTYLALEPHILTNSNDDKIISLYENTNLKDTLVLSTVHSAKGLEWNTVFIIWAVEGRFPAFNSLTSNDLIEEERRLLYVAMTRAKENLYICVPQLDYEYLKKSLLTQPSRFIIEIGYEYFDIWKIKING